MLTEDPSRQDFRIMSGSDDTTYTLHCLYCDRDMTEVPKSFGKRKIVAAARKHRCSTDD